MKMIILITAQGQTDHLTNVEGEKHKVIDVFHPNPDIEYLELAVSKEKKWKIKC